MPRAISIESDLFTTTAPSDSRTATAISLLQERKFCYFIIVTNIMRAKHDPGIFARPLPLRAPQTGRECRPPTVQQPCPMLQVAPPVRSRQTCEGQRTEAARLQ